MLPQFMSYQNLWVWIRIVTVVQTKASLTKCKGLIFSWWCLELCHLFYFPKHIAIINASDIFIGIAWSFFLTCSIRSHSNHVKIYKKWNLTCEPSALHVHCKCMVIQVGVSGLAFHICSEVIIGSYYHPLLIMPYV